MTQNDMTVEIIERAATSFGLKLSPSISGPYLKLEAFTTQDNEIVGYLTAFIRPIPSGLFHLETIQVKNRRQYLGYKRKGWKAPLQGISFLMGSWALQWAREKGCSKAQLLAVKDSEQMNQILVRLYERFGFRVLREVSSNLFDRITWGAEGTLMELDLESFFKEWDIQLRSLTPVDP